MIYVFISLLIVSLNIVSQELSVLDQVDINSAKTIELIEPLSEISGLALSSEGTLFTHNDELGYIYEIDPMSGEVLSRFSLGLIFTPNDDFEGIALVENELYIITSEGYLYKSCVGKDGSSVSYSKTNLGLNKFNFEGLCYDSKMNQLIFVAKNAQKKKYKHNRMLFSYNLESEDVNEFLALNQKSLKKLSVENNFSPSGIEYDKNSDHFFIIAAKGNMIIEIDRSGNVISSKQLDQDRHPQPEGVTILNNKTLIISDENAGAGLLTIYQLGK